MRASLRERTGREHARILVGLVASGLVIGGAAVGLLRTAGEWMEPGNASAASAPAPSTAGTPANAPAKAPTTHAPIPAPNAAPTAVAPAKTTPPQAAVVPSQPAAAPAKPAVAPARPGVAPANPPAAAPVAGAPAKPVPGARVPGAVVPPPAAQVRNAAAMSSLRPVSRQVVQPLAHLDERQTYQYNALGRRDPFAPLTGGAFVGEDVGGDAPPDIGGIKVVGIVWGSEDKFALCEDGRGHSMVLRKGDKVMNGVVEGLKRDQLIVNLTVDGQSQSVAIPLTRKGENANANR